MDIVCPLRTFSRGADTGSFSAAAFDLNVTQPAVSRQVSALEAHLNMRLLHRSTTALALMAEGKQAIPMALKVIEAVEALSNSASPGGAASGKIRLLMASPPAPDSNRRRTVETALHSTKASLATQRAAARLQTLAQPHSLDRAQPTGVSNEHLHWYRDVAERPLHAPCPFIVARSFAYRPSYWPVSVSPCYVG